MVQVGDEVTKDEPITTNPNVGGFGQVGILGIWLTKGVGWCWFLVVIYGIGCSASWCLIVFLKLFLLFFNLFQSYSSIPRELGLIIGCFEAAANQTWVARTFAGGSPRF